MFKSIKKIIIGLLALTSLSALAWVGCNNKPVTPIEPDEVVHTEHKYVNTVTEPTCTTGGSTKHVCEVCGFSYTDSITQPKGHTPSEPKVTVVKESTCTEEGKYTETIVCTVCGIQIGEPETKISSMHKYVNGTCSVCGITLDEEAGFSALGFKFDKSTTPTTLSRMVSNAELSFDLNKSIKVSSDCVWKVYADEAHTQEITDKVMTPLTVGHNYAYLTISYAGDTLYTSSYRIDLQRLNKFKYSFYNGETEIIAGQVEEFYSQYPLSANPKKTNYDFAYWAVNGEKVDFPYTVTKTVKFDAVFTPTKYKINYVLNGGEFNTEYPQTYDCETAVAFKTPLKSNYAFAGWFTDPYFAGKAESGIPVNNNGDRTYYAKWTAKDFEITYEFNGGNFTTEEYISKFTVETPTFDLINPVKTGYSFGGWYLDATFRELTSKIEKGTSQNIKLFARWVQGTEGLSYILSDDNSYYILASYEGGLTTLNVPDKFSERPVKGIKAAAFKNNTTLTSVVLPETLETIGDSAFEGCSALTAVLPNSIKSIGKNAFKGCALTEIVLPVGLTSLGIGAFTENANLASITLNSTNLVVEGAPFTTCPAIQEVNIGTGVTKLPDNIFSNIKSLQSISIPDNVTVIGVKALYGCDNITELVIGDNVVEIGLAAFGGMTKLNSITLPFIGNLKDDIRRNTFFGYIFGATTAKANKANVPASLESVILTQGTAIVVDAFNSCDKIKTIDLPDTITQIGNTAFLACNALTEIDLPDGVAKIGIGSYQNCTSVTEVTIPNSVLEIGKDAFVGCSKRVKDEATKVETIVGLKTVIIGTGITKLPDGIFKNCEALTTVPIPDQIVEIGPNAFYGCSSLVNITIPDGVKTIGLSAFQAASSLESVVIPNSVETLAANAFSGCIALESVTLSTKLKNIQPSMFNGCKSLTDITVPANITIIGALAFNDCSALTDVYLTNALTAIESNAFRQCVSLNNITNIEGLQRIGSNAFNGCKTFTDITIPQTVTEIGSGAFGNCDSLAKLTIPFVGFDTNQTNKSHFGYIFGASTPEDNSRAVVPSLKEVVVTGGTILVNKAFINCGEVVKVTLPHSMTEIGVEAFKNCAKLADFTLNLEVTSIGNSAFKDCTSLAQVNWNAKSATASETNSTPIFQNCTTLATIVIANSVESLPKYAFFNNSAINNVTIGTNVVSIEEEAFKGCTGISSLTLPDSLQTIGTSAFEGCVTLGVMVIPKNVALIGVKAFSGCVALSTLQFADSGVAQADESASTEVELTISEKAFENIHVTELVVPNRVVEIKSAAFKGCTLLENLQIPFIGRKVATTASAETMFGYIFGTENYTGSTSAAQKYNSSSTVTNYIPTSLKNIVVTGGHVLYGSFYNCSKIETVDISNILHTADSSENNTTLISEVAFYACSSLTQMEIPSFIKTIGVSAFANCSNMQTLTFETNSELNAIGNTAFQSCSKLQGVAIPAAVTTIGTSAFQSNSQLASLTFDATPTGQTPVNLTINPTAFQHCSLLTTVVVPDRVQTIDSAAFNGCAKLTSLTLPFIGRTRSTSAGSNQVFGYIFGTSNYSGSTLRNQYSTNYYIPNSLTDVTITGGNVLAQSFISCQNIVNIVLPSSLMSVTSIGDSAFASCSNLTTITIPATTQFPTVSSEFELPVNTTSIGASTFSSCSKLTQINIPQTVTSIGNSAFQNCSTIASLTLTADNALSTIGSSAFASCSNLVTIDFGSIPQNSLTMLSIGASAFLNCSKLKGDITNGLVVPAHVSSIGANAFQNCSQVAKFSIERKTLNDEDKSRLSSIGDYAFDGCTSMSSIDFGVGIAVSGSLETALSIGNYAFRANNELQTLNINQRVTSIATYAFQNCAKLDSVIVETGSRLTSIGNYAFNGCSKLQSVTFNDNVLSTMGSYVFAGCSTLSTFNFGTSTTNLSIGTYAFQNCYTLQTLVVPNNVSSMGQYIFSGCYGLQNLTIPFVGNAKSSSNNTAYDLGYMFLNTSYTSSYQVSQNNSSNSVNYYIPNALTKVVVTGGNILSGAFDGCKNITSITLPDNITSIGAYAFRGCTALSTLNYISDLTTDVRILPESVTTIYSYAFQNCTTFTSFTLPSKLNSLQNYAFSGCTNLATAALPQTLETLGTYAFQNCSSLVSTTANPFIIPVGGITEGSKTYVGVKSIGEYTFSGCTTLQTFVIPNNVTALGQYAFSGCTSLQSVTLSDNVQTISTYAFSGCSALSDVTIPANVKFIEANAFQNNSALSSITFTPAASGATELDLTIKSSAFKNCTTLTNVEFPDRVVAIENGVLSDCKNIHTLSIPFIGANKTATSAATTTVFGHIFGGSVPATAEKDNFVAVKQYYSSSAAYTSYIPTTLATVTVRGGNFLAGSFDGMNMIEHIVLPKTTQSATTLGAYAFRGCTALVTLKLIDTPASVTKYLIPENITTIDTEAFAGCTNGGFTELQVPVGVTKINTSAFKGSDHLATVNLTNCLSLTTIDISAYQDCTTLSSVTLPENLTTIGNNAFYNTKISAITVPVKVSSIGASAFEKCASLTTITIVNEAAGVIAPALAIGNNAFKGCELLTDVTIPTRTSSMGTGVFSDCSKIRKMTLAFAGSAKTTTSVGATMVFGTLFTVAPTDATQFTTVKQYYNAYFTTAYIPNTLREVVLTGGNLLNGVFDGMSMLTSITLPTTVQNQTALGDYAFRGCTALATLKLVSTPTNASVNEYVIPENITQIGQYAFYGCNNAAFKEIRLPNPLTKIYNDAFNGCTNLNSINIPSIATDIGVRAFAACPKLTTMTLPFTGTTKAPTSASANTLFGAIFASTNPQAASETPVLYNAVDQYYTASAKATYYIPKTLTSVTILGGNIMFGAFDNMSQLTTLNLPATVNNPNTSIGQWAFRNCSGIGSFTLPTNIQSIGSGAFNNCNNAAFKVLVVPDTVASIGSNAFSGCPNLTTLTLPFIGTSKTATAASVNTLFGVVFSNIAPATADAAKYNTVVQNASDTVTGTYYIPATLKTVTITGGNILFGAFDGMSQLTSLTLPTATLTPSTAIGKWAFRNCSNLTEIAVPGNVSRIDSGIFVGCSKLTKVTLPFVGNQANTTTSASSVFGYVFSSTEPTTDATLYNAVTQKFNALDTGSVTYYIPKSLKTVVILGGNVLYGSFSGMSQLTSIVLPTSGITTIGDEAFKGCTGITTINVAESVTTIGASAFSGCTALRTMTISTKTLTIGDNAFSGCSFTRITIMCLQTEANFTVSATGNAAFTSAPKTYTPAT